jgi:hypothetical protein
LRDREEYCRALREANGEVLAKGLHSPRRGTAICQLAFHPNTAKPTDLKIVC